MFAFLTRESLTCVWQNSGCPGRCHWAAAQFPRPPILEPPCHWFLYACASLLIASIADLVGYSTALQTRKNPDMIFIISGLEVTTELVARQALALFCISRGYRSKRQWQHALRRSFASCCPGACTWSAPRFSPVRRAAPCCRWYRATCQQEPP